MTMEYKVGHYFKRMTMIDTLFGDADHHLRGLARRGALAGRRMILLWAVAVLLSSGAPASMLILTCPACAYPLSGRPSTNSRRGGRTPGPLRQLWPHLAAVAAGHAAAGRWRTAPPSLDPFLVAPPEDGLAERPASAIAAHPRRIHGVSPPGTAALTESRRWPALVVARADHWSPC